MGCRQLVASAVFHSCTMKTLRIIAGALLGFLCGFPSQAGAADRITSASDLAALRGAPLERVLEVFTGESYLVQVPGNPRAMVNTNAVDVIDVASSALEARIEEAREALVKLLDGGTPEVKGRVLRVLASQEPARLEELKPTVLPMLKDPLRDVRRNAVALLEKVKDEPVEAALVEAISLRNPLAHDGDEYSEISRMIEVVCEKPFSEERVIPALLPWLDESKAAPWVIRYIVLSTAPFSRSGPYADRLMAAQWDILRTTREEDSTLASTITRVWDKDHPLALAYLRRTLEIANDQARSEVASALIRHRDFDPRKEGVLLEGLLNDRAERVSRFALSALCAREDLPASFRLSKALLWMGADHLPEVRKTATSSVFRVLRDLSIAEADKLMREPTIKAADQMLAGLKDELLRDAIAVNTSYLPSAKVLNGLSGERLRECAIQWWTDPRTVTVREEEREVKKPERPRPRPWK